MPRENKEVAERMRATVKKDLASREGTADLKMWGPAVDNLSMPGDDPGEKGVKESEAQVGSPAPEPSVAVPQEAKAPEADPDSRAKRDFKQMGDRLKQADSNLKTERATNQELQERLRKFERDSLIDRVVHEERPQQYADWDLERQSAYLAQRVVSDQQVATERAHAEMAERVATLESVGKTRDLQDATGFTGDQLAAAQTIRAENGGLSNTELISITKDRHPDLFPQPDPEVPASHRVNRPTPPGQRKGKPDPNAELRETVRSAEASPQTRKAAMQQLVKKALFP
jgi:DNA-binding HxlR family transcriptional regulator